MKILIFGNPLLDEKWQKSHQQPTTNNQQPRKSEIFSDSLPIKLLPKLQEKFPNIEFKEIDPTEDLEKQGEHLTIIDTVEGIKQITILKSIKQLHANKIYSMHDFDLALNLKLLKKLNIIKSVKIIGIPMNISEEEALKQISNHLKQNLS